MRAAGYKPRGRFYKTFAGPAERNHPNQQIASLRLSRINADKDSNLGACSIRLSRRFLAARAVLNGNVELKESGRLKGRGIDRLFQFIPVSRNLNQGGVCR